MMHAYNKLFKPMFQQLAETCQKKLKFTQEHMAEALYISPRSYRDFKAGKYSLSASTLLMLLLLLSDEEVLQFFHQMRQLVEQTDPDESTGRCVEQQ